MLARLASCSFTSQSSGVGRSNSGALTTSYPPMYHHLVYRSCLQKPVTVPQYQTYPGKNVPIDCVEPFAQPWPGPKRECGFLEVPLDYHDWSAGQGRIHYIRLPADLSVERKGTIFVQPGGFLARPLQNCQENDTQSVVSCDCITGLPWKMSKGWLLDFGDVLRTKTGGQYDIVLPQARGNGDGSAHFSMFVLSYVSFSSSPSHF